MEEWEALYNLRILDIASMPFFISMFMLVGAIVNAGYIMKYRECWQVFQDTVQSQNLSTF